MYYMQGRIQRCVRENEKGGGVCGGPDPISRNFKNIYKMYIKRIRPLEFLC